MIRFEEVTKVYNGGQQALNRVNFHLEAGEMAFLTGHSGAGKSTLLKLVAMMERPTSGQVYINGHNLNKITKKQIPFARRDIGMIFQNHRLLMDRSVFNNVAIPLIIEGYHLSDIKRRVAASLDKVGLLSKLNNMPHTLSGGELQRVGIARAIVNKPPLLLADEPTGNLDPALSLETMRVFEELNSVGVAVLIATHDLGLIARMKYHTFTLNQGQLIQDGLSSTDLQESEFEPVI